MAKWRAENFAARRPNRQDRHWTGTHRAQPKRSGNFRGSGPILRVRWLRLAQQGKAQGQEFRAPPMREKPEVPDAHKALRQHVQKEPPQKLW